MLYRAEIWSEKRLLAAQLFQATHPKQAIRRILGALEQKKVGVQFMTVYVLNEVGQIWVYALRQRDGKRTAKNIGRSTDYLPQNLVQLVFAGNRNIAEVVG